MSSAGYDPTVYDLFHDTQSADVRFYLELARSTGGPVLELGAGTGRTLLPIARAGIPIDGLDLDDAMASALEDKLTQEPSDVMGRVRVHRGDMRSFLLPERYKLVQIPFRAFLHNVTRDSQLECLRSCFDHLHPGGTLAFNVFHPSLQFMSENQGQLAGVWRVREDRVTDDGGRILMSDSTEYDPPKQRLRSRLRYEQFDASGLLTSTKVLFLDLAYMYPGDLRELLRMVGFTHVRIDGGFDGRDLERDGDEQVVRATRP